MATLDRIFKFFNKQEDKDFKETMKSDIESFAPPANDDGAKIRYTRENDAFFGGYQRQLFDGSQFEIEIKNTSELIGTYRAISKVPEVERAIREILNDAIVKEDGYKIVSLDLEETNFSDNIKSKINEEFDNILGLYNFKKRGKEYFKRWYIDSRIFFHKIMHRNPKKGIAELRRLDPRYVQFEREIIYSEESGQKIVKGYREYFLYKVPPFDNYSLGNAVYSSGETIRIPKDAIVYCHSGEVDECGNASNIIGYLHNAVKPINQLKMLEDAMCIYRITRAPDRRVWYIDTGIMGGVKAQQHMNSVMQSMKTKVSYDSATGKMRNAGRNLSMTEDFWLQRKDGKATTSVDTLAGATGMNEIEDIRYLLDAAYRALYVPKSRYSDDGGSVFNSGIEISRDEITFNKFIRDLQYQFGDETLLNPLLTNLLMKNIITKEEWIENIEKIELIYHRDSYFDEIMEADVLNRRIDALEKITPYIGKYYSNETAQKKFLKMTDDEIKDERKLIEDELSDEIYNPPIEEEEEINNNFN